MRTSSSTTQDSVRERKVRTIAETHQSATSSTLCEMAPDAERGAVFRRYPSCCPAAYENRVSLRSARVQLRKSTADPRPMMAVEINIACLSSNGNRLTCGVAYRAISINQRTRTTIALVVDGPACYQQEVTERGKSCMYRKDTHVSAIDRTSYAFSYQGRTDGGKREFGINGLSLDHSDSVNASASVPSSQLCDTGHVMIGLECCEDVDSGESSAYLSVDMLTALSRARRRIVRFSPRYARDHRVGAGTTRAGRENAI